MNIISINLSLQAKDCSKPQLWSNGIQSDGERLYSLQINWFMSLYLRCHEILKMAYWTSSF